MRALKILVANVLVLGAATMAVVACSSSNSGPEPGGNTGPTPSTSSTAQGGSSGGGSGDDASGGACNLQASGLSFSSAACDTCMQTSCCDVTVTCVKTDPNCALLQQCILSCPVPGAGGGKDGGGGGDGGGKKDGGGSGGDGGTAASCRDACMAQYPAAQMEQKGYNDCITGPCGPACLGTAPTDGGHEGGGDSGPKDAGKG